MQDCADAPEEEEKYILTDFITPEMESAIVKKLPNRTKAPGAV
jgi:hypothetical protein